MISMIWRGKGTQGRVVRRGEPISFPTKRTGGPIPVPPGTLFGVQIDDYQGFNRAYWNPSMGDIYDGQYHKMEFFLKIVTPNPGGTLLADTDALRANTGTSNIMWWDNNGTLGKMYLRQNDTGTPVEMTAAQMADAIDAHAQFIVRPDGQNLYIVGIIPEVAADAPAPPVATTRVTVKKGKRK